LETSQEELKAVKQDSEEQGIRITTLTEEKNAFEESLNDLKELLSTKKSEQDREVRAREKVETLVKILTESVTKRESEIASKSEDLKKAKEQISKLESIIRDEKLKIEKETKERDFISIKFSRLQSDYDEQSMAVTKLEAQNQNQAADLKNWEDELNRYKEDYRSMVRAKESLQKRIKSLEDGKVEAEVERDMLKVTDTPLSTKYNVSIQGKNRE
jgi:chromosome segregation ATPase